VLAVVEKQAVQAFITHTKAGYAQNIGVSPSIYVCQTAQGASILRSLKPSGDSQGGL
jgi:galactokinase